MRKILITSLGAIAVMGLSACSEKAQDQVEQAGDAVGNDIERGIINADDMAAAGADKMGAAVDNAGHEIGAAADEAGAKIEAGAADAKHDIGSSVEKAGKDIKD